MTKKRGFLIFFLCLVILLEVLLLRPSSIETNEQQPISMFSQIETMIKAQKQNEEIAYTLDAFHYTAVEAELKQWEITAKRAFLYEKSKIMVAQEAHIKMFDPDGKVTDIFGDEAAYRTGEKDLNLLGNVKVIFPDGFWIKTPKAFYESKTTKIITDQDFYGEASPQKNELMQMWGVGFYTFKTSPEIFINKNAHVRLRRTQNDEITDVRSDLAKIDRVSKIAYFNMVKPTDMVESDQGTLRVKSKRQEAVYDSSIKVLKYLTAFEDVLIKEMDPQKSKNGLKYATCQKAEFMTSEDKVILSGFPSAYQDLDTVTGDVIVVYRKQNIIEVTQANAYHESPPPAEPKGTARE